MDLVIVALAQISGDKLLDFGPLSQDLGVAYTRLLLASLAVATVIGAEKLLSFIRKVT